MKCIAKKFTKWTSTYDDLPTYSIGWFLALDIRYFESFLDPLATLDSNVHWVSYKLQLHIIQNFLE